MSRNPPQTPNQNLSKHKAEFAWHGCLRLVTASANICLVELAIEPFFNVCCHLPTQIICMDWLSLALLTFVEFAWCGKLRYHLQMIVTTDVLLVTFIEILLGVHCHHIPLQINHVAQFFVALVALWNGAGCHRKFKQCNTFSQEV